MDGQFVNTTADVTLAKEGLSAGDTAWVLASSALVLLMTPGLAFFYGGLVRGNNVLNTMMMSIISMGVVSVPWLMFTFSLAFGSGGGPIIGDFEYLGLTKLIPELWSGTRIPALLFVVFQMTFAVIAGAIISGAIVERMRFSAFTAFIFLWSVLVYAPVCHWVWGPGGWIVEMGAVDFAGGVVVHESTAVTALTLALLLGPRSEHEQDKKKPPHNVPFVVLGAGLLWFGWSGFNGGSALAADQSAALALVNTYGAAAASLTVWACLERFQFKCSSTVGAVTGAIVGLVIITPAAGAVTPIGAVVMGAVGCVLVYPTFQINYSRLDDSLDCFPCHGVSGFVGTVLTGLFATDGGLFYGGGFKLVGVQCVAALTCAAYAAVMTCVLYGALGLVMKMRVPKDQESFGLDHLLHGESAYVHHGGNNDSAGSVSGSSDEEA